jgi:predicted aspartyl protease
VHGNYSDMKLGVFLALAIAALLAIVAVPHSSPAAQEAGAAEVMARHAAYVGNPPGLVLRYRWERDASATPPPTPPPDEADIPRGGPPDTVIYRRGALYHRVVPYNGYTRESGFTGRAFWSADENGYTVVLLEDQGRLALTENAIESGQLGDAALESRGTRTVDGVACDMVRVTPPSGMTAEVAVDRATGAFVHVTYDPDDRYRHSEYSIVGYKEIAPGVRVPAAFKAGPGENKLIDGSVKDVTNEQLRGPLPTPKWTFASTDTAPIEFLTHPPRYGFLPPGKTVLIHATINGTPGTFLLDSGNGADILLYSSFTDKLAKKLTVVGRTGFSGINGRGIGARLARVDTLEVGKNTLSNVLVSVAKGSFGSGIDGILGYDFLAGALVDVSLADRTIRILDPSKYEPTVAKGAYAFPVNLASRQPGISLRVSGVTTKAVFDSGDEFLVALSDDLTHSGRVVALSDTIRITDPYSGAPREFDYDLYFMGVDGPASVPSKCSRINELEIGPYRYEGVETCFASAKVFGKDGGLIGMDFLQHFDWTFDYADGKVVLTPNGL